MLYLRGHIIYEWTSAHNKNHLRSVINKDAVIKTFTSEGYFYIPSILPFFDAVNPLDAELSGIQITSHCLAGYVRCEPNTRISVEIITPAYKVDAALRLSAATDALPTPSAPLQYSNVSATINNSCLYVRGTTLAALSSLPVFCFNCCNKYVIVSLRFWISWIIPFVVTVRQSYIQY